MKQLIFLCCFLISTFSYSSTNEFHKIQVGDTTINTMAPADLVIVTPEYNELYQELHKYHSLNPDNHHYFDYIDLEHLKKNQNLRMCSIFASRSAFNLPLTPEQFQVVKPSFTKSISDMLTNQSFLDEASQIIQKQFDSSADTVGVKLKSTQVEPSTEFYQDERRILYLMERKDSLEFLNQKFTDKEYIALGFLLLKDKIVTINCKSNIGSSDWNKQKLITWSDALIEINKENIIIQIWNKFIDLIVNNWIIRIIFILLLIQIGSKFINRVK